MKQEDLIKAIVDFASLDDSTLADKSPIIFWIDIQPNSILYGGEFQFGEHECRPIDLRKIGKFDCHRFTEILQNFHRDTTDQGRNKWNRARIEKRLNGLDMVHFIWDQEWEENEIKGYIELGSARGKWYWEEK